MKANIIKAKVLDIMSFEVANKIKEVYLIVEYNNTQNAVHLGRILKYEFDGLHSIDQDICDKALIEIPNYVEVYVDNNKYCNLTSDYYSKIKDAFRKSIYK